MVGDYFAAAMDEEAIAAAGAEPLAPWLARFDAVESVGDIRGFCPNCSASAWPPPSLGISPDFEDSDAYLVYLGQGGLGLPERDYYTRDDERSVALRGAYVAHMARQFANLGRDQEEALDTAERILDFETRLAQVSYPAEKMRDVQLTMNRHDVASLDELMPSFGLSVVARGRDDDPDGQRRQPGFFKELEAALDETPIETLRDQLRWNLVRTYASSLSPVFENEAFDFWGRTLGGQQELRPRWKRVLDTATGDIGDLVAQLYVDAAFSAAAKQRCEQMVDHLLSAMGGDPRRRVDDRPDQDRRCEKLAGFSYKIGYPDKWRDYSGSSSSAVPSRTACAARPSSTTARWAASASRWTARVGDARAHGQRLLPPAAQRDRLPRRDPAAAVLRRGRRRRHELRRHRRGHRPRDDARLRRPGPPIRRAGPPARLVDRGRPRGVRAARADAGRAVRRLQGRSTTCTSTAGSRWARTSPTWAA